MKTGKFTISSFFALVMLSIPALAGDAKLKLKTGPGQTVPMDPAKHDGKINADFPEPTDVRDIAKAFSLSTEKAFVFTSFILAVGFLSLRFSSFNVNARMDILFGIVIFTKLILRMIYVFNKKEKLYD